jgi:hypothetical protein
MAMFGVQAYMAGAMGVPGFAEADKFIEYLKKFASEKNDQVWAKIKDFSLKQLVLDSPGGEAALYGGASTQSGVALTSRAAAPIPSEMIQTPGAPIADLLDQAGNIGKLAVDPLNPQKQAQVAMTSLPSGLIGAAETGVFKDQTSVQTGDTRTYGSPKNLADRKGMYSRTPEEEKLRALGFRSQKEAVVRELEYKARTKEMQSATVLRALPNKIYNDLRNNNMGSARDRIKLYAELSGKSFTRDQLETQIKEEYMTPGQRMASKKSHTVESALALARLNETLDKLGY